MNRYALDRCAVFFPLLLGLSVSACSVADSYGPRAISYNVEAQNSRTSTTLLNIVRAAYAEPLQFTDLSSVAGTASASGTFAAMLPVLTGAATLTPSGTVSGGPTFNIANLNTQEFYSGIQSPLDLKTIQNLVDVGYDRDTIMPIVIGSIQYNKDNDRIRVDGQPDEVKSFISYYSSINQMVGNGLSIEKTSVKKVVGPVISRKEAGDLLEAYIKSTATAVSGNKIPDIDVPPTDKSRPLTQQPRMGYSPTYAVLKETGDYRFCFDPALAQGRQKNQSAVSIGHVRNFQVRFYYYYYDEDKQENVKEFKNLPDSTECGQSNDASAGKIPDKDKPTFQITPRSVEGMIYFLGDIARIELGLGNKTPQEIPWRARNGGNYTLFRLRKGIPGPADTSVAYKGEIYFIKNDPSGRDASAQILQLLADLQALESKAANLPAPIPISILSR